MLRAPRASAFRFHPKSLRALAPSGHVAFAPVQNGYKPSPFFCSPGTIFHLRANLRVPRASAFRFHPKSLHTLFATFAPWRFPLFPEH